ncbi:hypothetical protein BH11ARM1_BH11ARM1_11770 [soil metagenome]
MKTSPYSVSRTEMMLVASKEYWRGFWWYMLIVPVFGLCCLIFGNGLLQAVGMMAILWPFSIPARSVLTTNRANKLFSSGCVCELTESEIVFIGEKAEPKRLRYRIALDDIKDVVDRDPWVLVRTRRLGFVPIRESAFSSDEEKAEFERRIRAAVQARMDLIPD